MNTVTATKKDYFLVSLIGFLFGLLLLPVLNNLELPFLSLDFKSGVFLVFGFTVFANLALALAYCLGRYFPVLIQLAKFGAAGGLNTMVDFGILNALISVTGLASGYPYAGYKGASFIVAATSSYFWNKYWTFERKNEASVKEFSQFFFVSIIGLVLNVGVASLVLNYAPHPAFFSPERWANLAAMIATLMAFLWNFLGYKFIVFKK
ncbi:GtrA family protein [Candidatus Wolfebacteria bacterium]|nr:GtrA family protein [Candidatus Wolfebacteria bacterium]